MIFIDASPIFHSSVNVSFNTDLNHEISLEFLRHLFLNQLRGYRKKFHNQYGELVICLDSKNGYWRKEKFPFYKSQRKEQRENSIIDWKEMFKNFDIIINELKEYFPYKVLDVDKAEADDIIAVLTSIIPGQHIIISNDKDFRQLHNENVSQFFPKSEKKEKEKNPDAYLFEQIFRGDKVDGIPNIKSPNNSFIDKIRQKQCREDFILQCYKNRLYLNDILTENEYKRYLENSELIDLKKIPDTIKKNIVETYNTTEKQGRNRLFEYFASRDLNQLINNIGDF